MSLINDPSAVARRLYAAMDDTDDIALLELLTTDFHGTVSAGMPHGVGGDHRGPREMLAVWARIFTHYDVHVEAGEYLPVDEDKVVVLGRYRGRGRDGKSTVDAAFAHIIRTRGDRIAALQQITDTAQWVIPATGQLDN